MVECQLQPQPTLNRLYCLTSPDGYTVVASGKSREKKPRSVPSFGAVGGDLCPEINGHVYLIDRQTGQPRWDAPAEIYGYCLPLDQAADSPALVLLQNTQTKISPNSPRRADKADLLILDKRDGRELFAKEGLRRVPSYAVEADPENQTVSVKTNVNEFLMTFTDEPIESAHPVQMKAEEATSTKALRNVRKIAGAILDAITENETKAAQRRASSTERRGHPPDIRQPEKKE